MAKRQNLVPTTEQEFRKANEIISPRVARGGTLSLLGRKVINVLLYHTQRQGVPGVGAPEGDPVFKTLYWLPLAELSRDSSFNSEDTALLKDTLLKLQDIKIITDDSSGFSSDVLIASVKILPSKRGGRTMIGWGLHPATEAILRSPEFYTKLSLYYLTSLKTTAGIALYENCKRYATNPSQLTRREPWQWWHDVLTGLPVGHEKPEYKYFKRDTLKPALAEVNRTDIRVEMIEHKEGRRVSELQFKIERVQQAPLELPLPPVIDTQLIQCIEAVGLSRREAEDVFAANDEAFLKATLALVEARIRDPKLPPIASPAAFFRTALRDRYVDGAQKIAAAVKPKPQPVAQKTVEPEIDLAQVAARKAALKRFDAMDELVQQDILSKFIQANPALGHFVRKNPRGRIVRQALADWLATQDSLK